MHKQSVTAEEQNGGQTDRQMLAHTHTHKQGRLSTDVYQYHRYWAGRNILF